MTSPLDPWLGFLPPQKLVDLYDRIAGLLDEIDKAEANPCGQEIRTHLAFDSTPRIAVPLAWEKVGASAVDRFTTMLSGPLFTSEAFPWPRLSAWRGGEKVPCEGYCEPIIQLDTALLSEIGQRIFDPGLVQVWMDDRDAHVRFIPAAALRSEALTAVPKEIVDFFSNGVPSTQNTYRDWPDDAPIAPWLVQAFSFVGTGEAFHEYPEELEYFLEDLTAQGLNISDHDIEKLTDVAADLHRELCDADGLSVDSVNFKKRYSPRDGECGTLFGRFRSVQSGSFDFFDESAIPLLDLGNWQNKFYWGDGAAQLLTAATEPGADYRFHWSAS